MVLCAAPNCNVRYGQGVRMFFFPKDYHLCKIWVKKLKTDKDYWPSQHTKLCERHFSTDCFPMDPSVARSLGYTRINLKKDAIPTIFNYQPVQNNKKAPKRKSSDPITGFTPGPAKAPRQAVEKRKTLEAKRRLTVLQSKENVIVVAMPPCSPPPIGELLPLTENDGREFDQPCPDVELPESETEKGTSTSMDTISFGVGTQTSYSLIKRRHAGIQTVVKTATTTSATQTEKQMQGACCCGYPTSESPLNTSFISHSSDSSLENNSSVPSEWLPSDVLTPTEDGPVSEFGSRDTADHYDRKFIVFEKCLDKLLSTCNICGRFCHVNKQVSGTYLNVVRHCTCGEVFQWGSQPLSRSLPLGNLILSGAILFSGGSIMQSLNLLQHANIACFTERTFHNLQQYYLVPAVERVWQSHQNALLARIKEDGRKVYLGGDARCCSPGHTAKYGSYSLMDLETNQILDIQLVQSNEVRNSYWMELEGLKRCLRKLDEEQVQVSDLVTDRHVQVKAFIRDERKEINHWFDVWHVAKGIYKKLESVGKKKKCALVGEWARSISNHIYWCAASSKGVGEEVQHKWLSVLNHISDVHEGHGSVFPKCLHGPLDDRAWIKKDSLPYMELEKVVKGHLLLKDIQRLSPAEQTSSLEAFHKVVCNFAPKYLHFFHTQMRARLYIAALHFNENSMRKQATNRAGERIFAVSYPKARKGCGVPKEVKIKQTFDYVTELLDEVISQREKHHSYSAAKENLMKTPRNVPVPISQTYPRQNKEQLVANHTSRFKTKN